MENQLYSNLLCVKKLLQRNKEKYIHIHIGLFQFLHLCLNMRYSLIFTLCFSDLIDDWSSKSIPDVYHFVPYTYSINLLINQFELVTLCNEYNWIDTSSQHPENGKIVAYNLVSHVASNDIDQNG